MHKFELSIHLLLVACGALSTVYGGRSFSDPVRRQKEYDVYSHHLSDGSIFIPSFLTAKHHKVDNSDTQYSGFRDNLGSLMLLAGVFLVLRRLLSSRNKPILPLIIGILFLLHGISSFKILAIVVLNYYLAKTFASNKNETNSNILLRPIYQYPKVVIWVFNIFFLFSNSLCDGYPLADFIHPSLSFIDDSPVLQGLLPHWTVHYNISMLRLLSFSLDYVDRDSKRSAVKDNSEKANNNNDKKGDEKDVPLDYSLSTYLTYVFYTPLYIAGPIMTFNTFSTQLHNPVPLTRKELTLYVFRFVACLFTMELILHNIYAVAIRSAGSPVWSSFTPFELSMFGFWNLIIVWMKLLLPWRFFRMWALLDGIVNPPENMIRCMANNYSTMGFWRGWHVSFNKWIIKYIYVPLGGNTRPVLLTLFVFTFVAVWHDLSFQLLAWGWVITLFVLPEAIAKKLISEEKYGGTYWYIHACALGGVFNVILMMVGNLIGFVIGVDGIKILLNDIFASKTHDVKPIFPLPIVIALTIIVLFSAVHIMMEYRGYESRRGIKRRF